MQKAPTNHQPSDNKSNYPCHHYGECGGCSLQHLPAAQYSTHKQQILLNLLADMGVDAQGVAQPLVEVGAASRRRVEWRVVAEKGQVKLGFYAASSHQLVAIDHCPVSDPAIEALLPAMRAALEGLKKPGRVQSVSVTALPAGVEAVLEGVAELLPADRQKLHDFAANYPLLRLCERIAGGITPLFDSGHASIDFAGVAVDFPPAGFLQASAKGQAAITQEVLAHLQGCRKLADLYCGAGTYSLPLIQAAGVERLSAFEGLAAPVAALHNAAFRAGLSDRLTATTRDLQRSPLSAADLAAYDGVVINPPRAGALPQAQQLAASAVAKIVMVSCHPATLRRDARALLQGGYTLTKATAIDQFTWSDHLEIVLCFTR